MKWGREALEDTIKSIGSVAMALHNRGRTPGYLKGEIALSRALESNVHTRFGKLVDKYRELTEAQRQYQIHVLPTLVILPPKPIMFLMVRERLPQDQPGTVRGGKNQSSQPP